MVRRYEFYLRVVKTNVLRMSAASETKVSNINFQSIDGLHLAS